MVGFMQFLGVLSAIAIRKSL